MTGSIQVLVRDKETRNEFTITYKSYLDTSYRFDLIGQVDDNGNLMDSDPNLQPQHQRKVTVKSPAVVDVGDKVDSGKIIAELTTAGFIPVEESHNSESITLVSSDGTSTSDPSEFHVEPSPAVEDSVQELPKQRKKPGPKPKNQQI